MYITQQLINWYQVHHRKLPWRDTSDPYLIWLSEIILQQTRVDQGMAYYYQFIDRFPSVYDLAAAEEEDVLRLWQGLGYYSRARNLHATAKQIVAAFGGEFPPNYDSLLKLKGVGDYTASAIASHAFGLANAVVDGNVYRFLARFYGIDIAIDSGKGQKYFKELATSLIDEKNASIFNQAIMEFGALQCKPKSPNCGICPFKSNCVALAENKVEQLPYKSSKTKVRSRYLNYFVVQDEYRHLVLKQRLEKDVWFKLYDFPLFESEADLNEEELVKSGQINLAFGIDSFIIKQISPTQIHLLSHQKLYIKFIVIEMPSFKANSTLQAYSNLEIEKMPLPKPIEQFLNKFLD